jgi:putative zinc finger/helix-turn-helix YgiT family protein
MLQEEGKMKCLQCEYTEFKEENLRFTPEIKGEEVEVVVPAFVCTHCKAPLMDTEQMNKLRRAAADEYRRVHHLLTSEEIVGYRTMLGMSQSAFANYLKVGEASIKRWETYYIQDVSQDEHIRLRCDEEYAEYNALELHLKNQPADQFNGRRRFSFELFKEVVCYLIEFTKSPLFLNKALFYADFKHFQTYGKSITGSRYVHLEYGPCPDQYQNLIQLLLDDRILVSAGLCQLKSARKADLTLFDDGERETLLWVGNLAKKDGGKKLLELSHEEDAFKKTRPLQVISYSLAKNLKI